MESRAVLVDSATLLCKSFLPRMAEAGGGRVVFQLPSGLPDVPTGQMAASSILKNALEGLAQSLAEEYAAAGLTVNCILPGPFRTESGDPGPVRPADVVPAVLFLLSEDAAKINGVTLPVGTL